MSKILHVVTAGLAFSPMAYCDPETGRPQSMFPDVAMAIHEFSATDDGCMVHTIDNDVRAIVPPQALEDYARYWPDSAPVVRQLLQADRVTPGPSTSTTKVVEDAQLAAAIAGLGLAPQ